MIITHIIIKKVTCIRPIYKKGNVENLNSYSPIGATSDITKNVEYHNIIDQFGSIQSPLTSWMLSLMILIKASMKTNFLLLKSWI